MNLQTESNKSFWVHATLHSHLTSTSTMWFVWKRKLKYPLLDNPKYNTGDLITFETQYCRLFDRNLVKGLYNYNQLVVFQFPRC